MSLRWKWIVIFAVLLTCAFGARDIRLGLDLQGGTQTVLQVQLEDAFKIEAGKAVESLKAALPNHSFSYESIYRSGTIEIHAQGRGELRAVVEEVLAPDWILTLESETRHTLSLRKEAAMALRQEIMAQTVRTIDRRVNELGIEEATVQQRQGSHDSEILVRLPGLDDPERVKRILQTTAFLEFAEVIGGPFETREAVDSQPNARVLPSRGGDWWLLAPSPVVTGDGLRHAQAQRNGTGGWDTAFSLAPVAAKRFEEFTQSHIGKRLAVVLDNVVLSAPVIESVIAGEGRIIGAAGAQEAADLAVHLRAGSLPASVKVMDSLRIGPSLGSDSIRQGLTSGIIGLSLVVASMVLYYRGAGFNAVAALLLNTLITVAVLNAAGAAWTLPGIAGLVLSIGMAVDSNVLIFERIKEETRNGRGIAASISAGFDRAITTIIDTHVTTVVASAFLFLFGTGFVRGFAVTLTIGLLANLFTAVFVSRAIFDLQLRRKPRLTTLSIGTPVGRFAQIDLDFMKKRKWTLGLSLLMIAVSIAAIAGFGLKPGLDFRGGTEVEVRFAENPGIDRVRHALASALAGEFLVQEKEVPGEFTIATQLEAADAVYGRTDEAGLEQTKESVEKTLRTLGQVDIRSSGLVGPSAGAETRQRAVMASAGALGGMLIYIAFRFKWIAGVAAVVATIHDVVITLGLFALNDREITLNIVAALLTLIGYSMNDKIVVFDRVRENQRLGRRATSFLALVNQSINQTLSRTILTAGPTLLACMALYLWGGEVLNGIAFALFAGIVAGTYSSIFVASALLVEWQKP